MPDSLINGQVGVAFRTLTAVATFFAVIAQALVFVFWLGTLSERVATNSRDLASLFGRVTRLEDGARTYRFGGGDNGASN